LFAPLQGFFPSPAKTQGVAPGFMSLPFGANWPRQQLLPVNATTQRRRSAGRGGRKKLYKIGISSASENSVQRRCGRTTTMARGRCVCEPIAVEHAAGTGHIAVRS